MANKKNEEQAYIEKYPAMTRDNLVQYINFLINKLDYITLRDVYWLVQRKYIRSNRT